MKNIRRGKSLRILSLLRVLLRIFMKAWITRLKFLHILYWIEIRVMYDYDKNNYTFHIDKDQC